MERMGERVQFGVTFGGCCDGRPVGGWKSLGLLVEGNEAGMLHTQAGNQRGNMGLCLKVAFGLTFIF